MENKRTFTIIYYHNFNPLLDIINMETHVSNNFRCVYNSIIDLDDADFTAVGVRENLAKNGVGTFGFFLDLYTTAGFDDAMSAGDMRVGSTLYFTVTQDPVLANIVFRSTKCSVYSNDRSMNYVLFDGDYYDPYVHTTRYRNWFSNPDFLIRAL
jgi:hypothetical protein